jgi:hypothetical protein
MSDTLWKWMTSKSPSRRVRSRRAAKAGPPGLLHGERPQEPRPARQRVHGDPGRLRGNLGGLGAAQQAIRIGAVDDIDAMAARRQLPREALHEQGIAAEAVRRVERGHHAETHGCGG